jgi:hypothetical protein
MKKENIEKRKLKLDQYLKNLIDFVGVILFLIEYRTQRIFKNFSILKNPIPQVLTVTLKKMGSSKNTQNSQFVLQTKFTFALQKKKVKFYPPINTLKTVNYT